MGDVDRVWPDKRTVRRRFGAAASGFDEAGFVHEEARRRLAGRLDFLRIEPRVIVDLGCGTGVGTALLASRFPASRIVAIDSSAGMLERARARGLAAAWLLGDAERLPLADASVDLIFANLVLPWCRPDLLVAEAARVLRAEGLLLLSAVGPDTLGELRRAWREVDDGIHVHAFLDMHDLGDLLGRTGLAEPVMDVDRLTVTYGSLEALTADLTACAGRNAVPARLPGLTSRDRWHRFADAVDRRRRDGRIGVSVELVFAQAWGRGRRPEAPAGGGEITVPIDRIGRR